VGAARNAPCSCGSGRKYKHCCLAAEKRAARAARFDDAVGSRIQDWAAETLGGEIDVALEEYTGPERTMHDDDLQIFSTWFHGDRELASGGTPAERYAARSDLSAEEREAAARIAAARLGLHRVLAAEPGEWIALENVLSGVRARVHSANVSRDAVRWDILLGRVMAGDPQRLWGPVRLFAPDEEPELLAELWGLAGVDGAGAVEDLEAALREHGLDLFRFIPPSRELERSYFTPEGDPMAHARAAWEVHEPAEACERLRALGGLAPGEPLEVDLTVRRDRLLAKDRPPLPRGALVVETARVGDEENVPVATVRMERGELLVETMSEERLRLAIEAVEADFGTLAELVSREVKPIEQLLEERDCSAPEDVDDVPSKPLDPAVRADLLSGAMAKWMHRWLDEPLPALDGESPREAVAGERRGEVVKLLRGIENRAERAGRGGEPGIIDAAWLRAELALDDDLAA
jgi:hypothetical protein